MLPPSPRTAAFHYGLRVFHQVLAWRRLSQEDIQPLNWGWKYCDGKYEPIMTELPPGPPELLNLVRCACKNQCAHAENPV